MELSQPISQFLDENRSRIRTEVSRHSYGQKLQHAERELGCLLEQDGLALRRWIDSKSWAPGTVRSYKVVLNSFYRWAFRTGLITEDASQGLDDLKPPARGVRRHHWLSADQVKAVINSCPDDLVGRRDRVALSLGFYTGLRNSEIRQLSWDDIDLTAGQIHVYGKGQKHAEVGISRELRRELIRWRSELGEVGHVAGPVVPALRSCWGHGRESRTEVAERPLSDRRLRKIVAEAGERAGIDGLTPHDMRRTLAGLLDNQGASLLAIRQALRHSSVATTERYLADNPARGIELLQGFGI